MTTPEHTAHIEAAETIKQLRAECVGLQMAIIDRDAIAKGLMACIGALTAERDAALALAADRLVDAERYRALPELDWYVGPTYDTYNDEVCRGEYNNHSINKAELDAAIDAARQAAKDAS